MDRDFGAIIDEAVRDEHSEVVMVKIRDRRVTQQLALAGVGISLFAIVVVASGVWLLLSRLQSHVKELMQGT